MRFFVTIFFVSIMACCHCQNTPKNKEIKKVLFYLKITKDGGYYNDPIPLVTFQNKKIHPSNNSNSKEYVLDSLLVKEVVLADLKNPMMDKCYYKLIGDTLEFNSNHDIALYTFTYIHQCEIQIAFDNQQVFKIVIDKTPILSGPILSSCNINRNTSVVISSVFPENYDFKYDLDWSKKEIKLGADDIGKYIDTYSGSTTFGSFAGEAVKRYLKQHNKPPIIIDIIE